MKKYILPSLILILSISIFTMSIVYGSSNKKNDLIYCKGYINSDNIQPSTTFSYSGLNVNTTGLEGYIGDFGIPEDGLIEFRFRITTDKKVSVLFEDPDGNAIIEENTDKFQYSKTIRVSHGNIKFKIISSDNASGQFIFSAVKKQ